VRRPPRAERAEEPVKAPSKPDFSSIFDDLDEDTRVLQHQPGAVVDVIDQAFERLQGLAPPPSAPSRAQPLAEPVAPPSEPRAAIPTAIGLAPSPDPTNPSSATEPSTLRGGAQREGKDESSAAAASKASQESGPVDDATHPQDASPRRVPAPPPSQPTGVWTPPADMETQGPVTERPAARELRSVPSPGVVVASSATAHRTVAHVAPSPARRVDSAPSVRVALLATTTPGEVRVIPLNVGDEAPPGAAIAWLVPFTPAEGEPILKLFRGGE
jgi:hypothetical protein